MRHSHDTREEHLTETERLKVGEPKLETEMTGLALACDRCSSTLFPRLNLFPFKRKLLPCNIPLGASKKFCVISCIVFSGYRFWQLANSTGKLTPMTTSLNSYLDKVLFWTRLSPFSGLFCYFVSKSFSEDLKMRRVQGLVVFMLW